MRNIYKGGSHVLVCIRATAVPAFVGKCSVWVDHLKKQESERRAPCFVEALGSNDQKPTRRYCVEIGWRFSQSQNGKLEVSEVRSGLLASQ